MRKVFTSPRLENVEAVAALLQDAGIQVKISEARSYRGTRRSSFTYRESEDAAHSRRCGSCRGPAARPAAAARGRLIDSSRAGESSYLPLSRARARLKKAQAAGKRSRAMRIAWPAGGDRGGDWPDWSSRTQAGCAGRAGDHRATGENPAHHRPQSADSLASYRVDVPSALAKLLVEEKLARAP
jgi:hypothetical protein